MHFILHCFLPCRFVYLQLCTKQTNALCPIHKQLYNIITVQPSKDILTSSAVAIVLHGCVLSIFTGVTTPECVCPVGVY